MKATVESTKRIVEVNGHPARIWQGKSENGADVIMVVCQVASPSGQPQEEFEADLNAHSDPSEHATNAIPLRLVL